VPVRTLCLAACRRLARPAAVVVKYGRARDFCGIALGWYAHAMADHEQAIYRALAGVPGVPAWVARLTATSYAIEYVPSESLDRFGPPPRGFFDRLRQLFDAVHANGVAYTDSNKRSNILVGPAGEAFLVDFQISMRRRDDLHWPLRAIVRSIIRYMQGRDLYHIYKHKRRLSPAEMTDEEMTLSRRRGFWHAVHRRATDPYRFIRRAILRSLHRKGALKSPTDHLEDLVQPEKATWRE